MKTFKMNNGGYQVITDRPIERSVYFCTEVDDGRRNLDLKRPRICFYPKGGKKRPYSFVQLDYFGRTPFVEDVLDAMEELSDIGVIDLNDELITQTIEMASCDINRWGAMVCSASGEHINPDYRAGAQTNGRIGYVSRGVYDPSVLYGLLVKLEESR